ncbi:MAG: 1-acyl-sn-glycerol-3-phosphate acyltransferase [SAR324 cluster bacterium]|nr:1-acyl-sn-glycerol-3-phosphate acyltransferase [SAR324 cluster bacterium]
MISIPYWVFFILLFGSIYAVTRTLFLPSLRWFFRRKVNKLVDQLNNSLDIQLQPFKMTKRQALIDRLINDPLILAAAEEYIEEKEVSQTQANIMVLEYAREIVPSFNAYFYFKVGNWLARKTSQLFYRVRLGFMDEAKLRAIDPKSSIVFVLNHRSNMDYILVSYFVSTKTAISYAVGEWAKVWPLQSLIQSLGAYFVRRKSSNSLYRKVLERYVQMATSGGVTQAIFLEGKLTTTGKLQEPRLGLLDYILRNYDPQTQRDITFIPVGINYDRTLEDRSLLKTKGHGGLKAAGIARSLWITFSFALKMTFYKIIGRWYRFGYACVNFGAPISTKQYLKETQVDYANLNKADRFTVVEALAFRLMGKIGGVVPALPVAILCQVFLQTGGEQQDQSEIKNKFFSFVTELQAQAVHVYIPRGNIDYTFAVGLRMLILRGLVIEDGDMLQANAEETGLFQYYANSIEHFKPLPEK